MKKKVLAIIMAGAMALSVAACGKTEGTNTTGETEKQTAEENVVEESTEAGSADEAAVTADSFVPSKDFSIRVPFAAGGSADTIARIVAQGLQETYGKSAVVNNLTGANGANAAADLDSAKSDATELMVGGIAMFTLAPLFNKDINMNIDDYQFVSNLVLEDQLLFVSPSNSGIEDWDGLVKYAADNRVVYGSNAPGGATHLLATMLFGEAGIEAEAVTSDSSAKDLLAVASGNVVCAIAPASVGVQYVEDGSLVPIAVFSEENYTGYEGYDVPTVQSLGYDIVFRTCNFIMTKADVNPDDVAAIHQAILDYSETDEFKELAKNANYTPSLEDGETVKQIILDTADLCKEAYEKYYAQ